MTEQQKIDIDAEIRGITIKKVWFYAVSAIAVLFSLFMMYSDMKEDNSLMKRDLKEHERRIEKLENKLDL